MDIQVVEKGITLDIKDKAGAAFQQVYVGAGWDFDGHPVDLDLVAACLSGGVLKSESSLIYFGHRSTAGIQLSEDNTTGEGDGDDENMVIDLSKVAADVDSIAIGVAAYSGTDLSTVKNFGFRICNGTTGAAPQVFEMKALGGAKGDTVLHAKTLKRSATGWTIENVTAFYKCGNGSAAIKGFANLFDAAHKAAA